MFSQVLLPDDVVGMQELDDPLPRAHSVVQSIQLTMQVYNWKTADLQIVQRVALDVL